jgi:hypothetical protein
VLGLHERAVVSHQPLAMDQQRASHDGDPAKLCVLTETAWAHTTVVDGSVPEFVRDLQRQPGAELLRCVGTRSGAVLVDYRVQDRAGLKAAWAG